MRKLLVATINLIWAATVYGGDPGEGAFGQSSWVGKGPDYFLNALPAPPTNGCPAKKGADKSFKEHYFKVAKELKDEVGKRQRALKKWNEQNSKKMMENAVDIPGFEGKSQAEMKKMSKAERKAMAEKMMYDKYGVSMEDLKKQKKANRDGKVMANVDFAKTMAGEQQANDLMKSKRERDADKKKVKDLRNLSKEQAELSQRLYKSVVGKSLSKLEELDQNEQRKALLEQIYDKEQELARMIGAPYKRPKAIDFKLMAEIIRRAAAAGDATNIDLAQAMGYSQPTKQETSGVWSVGCETLNIQGDDIYMARLSYCNYTSGKFIAILNEFRMALSFAMTDYRKLDQVTSDLQKAQVGIGLSDAALGLSGLEAIQQYAALLGQAYANDPGEKRDPANDAGFCTGAAE